MMYVLKCFSASQGDLLSVYQLYVRPILEYACPLWHTSLTKRQADQIELVQKRACRLILGQYNSYREALEALGIMSLFDRRETLLVGFVQKLLGSEKHRHMLPAQRSARHIEI